MADTEHKPEWRGNVDEKWVEIQKKTFTRWMNTFLKERLMKCDDLAVDLKTGVLLINLLEIISSKTVATKYTKNPKIKTQMLENNQFALQFLAAEGIKLVNIGNEDITDGKLKLILGLIWTIILRYHINIEQGKSARSDLLKWVQSKIPEYNITGFTKDWNDGRAICALADAVLPGTFPHHKDLKPANALQNATEGTNAAEEKLGIPKVLDPIDMINPEIDELSVMTYVSYFRDWEGSEGRKREQERIERTPVPAKCRAFGPGLERAETYQPTQFTIEAINANNRRVPVGGAPFAVKIQGPKGEVPFEMVDENNGLYQVTYTPVDAGKLTVSVTLSDIGIQGNPWTVPVTRTGPSAGNCRAYGPGLEGGIAGEKAPFTIEAVGPTGQKLSDGGDPFTVKATGPHGPAAIELVDNKDGTYAASYMPLDPGPYKVEVSLNGAPIANSPFTVNIDKNPNDPDASKCRAYGPGLEGGNTAEPSVFFVEVNTPSGNRYAGSDAPIAVDITDPAGNVVPVTKGAAENGDLQFTYQPKDAGVYKVDVVLKNKHNPTFYEHVPGSTFSVAVAAGTDAGHTVAYGPGVEGPVNDVEPTHFTIEARDNKGTKLPRGGDPFEVTVAGPHGSVPAKVHDNGDGTYKVEYAAKEPGPHKVNVELKGKPIKGAPFTVDVAAGTNPDKCIAYGPGVEGPVEDTEPTHFTIEARDNNGNKLPHGGDPFEVSVTGPSGNVPAKVTDNGDGTYKVEYAAQEPGPHKVNVELKGKPIKDAPFTVNVDEGADYDKSRVETYTFSIRARSKRDTQLKTGGDRFRVAIDGPSGPLKHGEDINVVDHNDGVYTVTYSLPERGNYKIAVTVGGKNIKGSPWKQFQDE